MLHNLVMNQFTCSHKTYPLKVIAIVILQNCKTEQPIIGKLKQVIGTLSKKIKRRKRLFNYPVYTQRRHRQIISLPRERTKQINKKENASKNSRTKLENLNFGE